MQYNYNLLDRAWFKKHQKLLLRIANIPLIGWLLRKWVGIKIKYKVVIISDTGVYSYNKKTGKYHYRLYAGQVVSRLIVEKFYPLFMLLHWFDKPIDKHIPELSFGFDTFSHGPQQGSGTTVINADGSINKSTLIDGIGWDSMRAIDTHGMQSNTGFDYLVCGMICSPFASNSIKEWARAGMSYYLIDIPPGSTVHTSELEVDTRSGTVIAGCTPVNIGVYFWNAYPKPGYNSNWGDIWGRVNEGGGVINGDWHRIGPPEDVLRLRIGHFDAIAVWYNTNPQHLSMSHIGGTGLNNWVETYAGGVLGLSLLFEPDNNDTPNGLVPGSNGVNYDPGTKILFYIDSSEKIGSEGPVMSGTFTIPVTPGGSQIIMIV